MSKADVPGYSGKDMKYLLMEVAKLVLPSRGGENGNGPFAAICSPASIFPPVEHVVTETQAMVG